MKNFKIKSYCKINLSLRVLKKLRSGYHNITSLITFCTLHDVISVSQIKGLKDNLSFSGKFKKGISIKKKTIKSALDLLRENKLLKNKAFKIKVEKKIPHGAGLGGGSSNAAYLLKNFNSKMKLNLSKKKISKIAGKVGFDVPINLVKKNTFLTGKKGKILRLNQQFKLNLLIVYPNIVCSTSKIYQKNKTLSLRKYAFSSKINNSIKLINFLKNERNDLEKTVLQIYPKVKKIINVIKSQKGCYISRITGSGSACIGIFSNMNNAINAKKLIKFKYPKYWCVVSKTI